MTGKIRDITEDKDLEELPSEDLENVSGGVLRRIPTRQTECGCTCDAKCNSFQTTESASAGLSGCED